MHKSFRPRAFAFALVAMVVIGMALFRCQNGAATSSTTRATVHGRSGQNKFVGRWSSQIKKASGHVTNDGVLDISDTTEPSADEVSVVHSVRGGPVTGYTMCYPDRIEIQISLSDGRVAHYNGILANGSRIEGHFFVTGNPQSHHARKRLVTDEESGTWTAQAGSG